MAKAVKPILTVVAAVIGFVVAGPIGAVVGAGIGYASADLVQQIINPGFDVPDTNEVAAQQNDGVLVNKAGTNNSIPVVYGQRRVGGSRVFVSTEGENNKYLHIVFAVSEGEIAGFDEIYMDDVLAWQGSSSHATRFNANQGKFKNLMTFETFHGTDNQDAAPLTLGVGGWSNQHRLRGIAYISFRLKWLKLDSAEDRDQSPWSSIPNITVVMRGKKIADATGFADSITRATSYSSETLTYDVNPINCLLDYLRNPTYGKGLSNDKINFKSFRDEAIRWGKLQDGTTTATGDQFHECNAVVFTDRTLFQNVKTFLFNCRAALPYQDGRFSVRVEDNRQDDTTYGTTSTSVMTVGEDAIIGTVNLEGDNVKGKVNRVIVTYQGGRQGDMLTNESVEYSYPETGSADYETYLAEDNGRVNESRLSFEHITQDSIARKYAEVALKKSRYRSKIVSFTGDASLHQLQVNDIFTLVHSGLGINGKFRVKSIQFNADYTFSITAEEHNDLIYGGNVVPYRRKTPVVSYSGSSVPVYVDLNGDAVHVGNKSDAPLPDDWTAPSTVPTEYNTVSVKYTQSELEAGLAAGTVIGVLNGEIIYAEPDVLPTPVITSAIVEDDQYGSKRVKIFFEKTDEPTIERVVGLIFSQREQAYFQTPTQNGSTAMRDGFLMWEGINPDRIRFGAFNAKVRFTGNNGDLVTTSEAVTVDFTGIAPNNIIFEEL